MLHEDQYYLPVEIEDTIMVPVRVKYQYSTDVVVSFTTPTQADIEKAVRAHKKAERQ